MWWVEVKGSRVPPAGQATSLNQPAQHSPLAEQAIRWLQALDDVRVSAESKEVDLDAGMPSASLSSACACIT